MSVNKRSDICLFYLPGTNEEDENKKHSQFNNN